MEDLLDIMFTPEQYIDDNIMVLEVIIDSLKKQKECILENQAKFVDVNAKIKSIGLNKRLKELQNKTFKEVLNIDKKIDENSKILEDLKKKKKEIF